MRSAGAESPLRRLATGDAVRRLAAATLALACGCGEGRILAADAPVAVSPLALDFGAVLVQHEAVLRLQLANPGRTPVQVHLAAPAPFAVAQRVVALPAASEVQVEVRFAPDLAGPQAAALAVHAPGVDLEVPMSGTSIAPMLDVAGAIDFAGVPVRAWAKDTLRIRSLAAVPLDVEVTLRDADHAFIVDASPLRLEPQGSWVLPATFAPPRRGAFEGILELRPCSTCLPSVVALRGRGSVEAIVPSEEALDFGAVTPGRTLRREVLLTNSGDLPLRVSTSVEGEGFSVTEAPLSLSAGEVATVALTFAPAGLGRHQGTLQITAGHDPVVAAVSLLGSGGGPDLDVDPRRMDFGLQPLGISAVRRAHLLDVGAGVVNVSRVEITGPGARAFALDPLPPLPLELGSKPLPIAMRFLPPLEGSFEAELVLATDDADEPEVRVPLTGQALLAPPCDARVSPSELRFGLVHRGSPAARQVSVQNAGTTLCFLSEVELVPSLGVFHLVDAPSSVFLKPGETLPITVGFEPVARAARSATLRLRISDPVRPDRFVAISGAGSDLDLVATPDPLDFGVLPLGFRGSGEIRLESRLPGRMAIESLRIAGDGTSGPFDVARSDLPAALEQGRPLAIPVGYLPRSERRDDALLEVYVAGEAAPFLVGLRGRGDDRPCGVLCADPVASCADQMRSRVGRTLQIPGSGWDPAGSRVSCRWSVVQAPVGSREAPAASGDCSATFAPDMVGEYQLQLDVTDPQLQTASCRTRISAQAPGRGLWIETYWDHADDVDLHLLHPDAGDPRLYASWFDGDLDCYYNSMNPDWDVPGDVTDDPSLDRDDTTFTGPENIRIDEPLAGHDYRIGVNWFSNVNRLPRLAATSNVYCGGSLAATSTVTLLRPGQIVFVGTVTFDGNDACEVRLDGTRIAP